MITLRYDKLNPKRFIYESPKSGIFFDREKGYSINIGPFNFTERFPENNSLAAKFIGIQDDKITRIIKGYNKNELRLTLKIWHNNKEAYSKMSSLGNIFQKSLPRNVTKIIAENNPEIIKYNEEKWKKKVGYKGIMTIDNFAITLLLYSKYLISKLKPYDIITVDIIKKAGELLEYQHNNRIEVEYSLTDLNEFVNFILNFNK